MKTPPLREPVQVFAHTHRKGVIAPDLVIWKRKTYNVTNIVKRRKQGKWKERIWLDVLVAKRMELEFDMRDKSWLLLHLEPDPVPDPF
jgi:hypothetical protein